MIQAALLAWKAASWGMRIAAVVGPLLVAGTVYGVWHHKVYSKGWNDALAAVARDDAAAVGRASKMRDQYESCADRKGAWDQTTGRCR
jgi:hypothetical protein